MRDKRRKPHNWEVINLRKFFNRVFDFHSELRNGACFFVFQTFGGWKMSGTFKAHEAILVFEAILLPISYSAHKNPTMTSGALQR